MKKSLLTGIRFLAIASLFFASACGSVSPEGKVPMPCEGGVDITHGIIATTTESINVESCWRDPFFFLDYCKSQLFERPGTEWGDAKSIGDRSTEKPRSSFSKPDALQIFLDDIDQLCEDKGSFFSREKK